MAIVTLTNSTSPNSVERATDDSDPYERETQLDSLAHNFDEHDHTAGKNLAVGRIQTASAPTAAGGVRVNGNTWQWWGASAAAVRTAVDVEGAQTVSGQKVFSANVGVGVTPSAWGSGHRALQVGGYASLFSDTAAAGSPATFLAHNTYYDGSDFKSLENKIAAAIQMTNTGAISFQNAPAVAAGATQTFTERLRLDAAGNLGLGATPEAFGASIRALRLGLSGVLWGSTTEGSLLGSNTYYDGANFRALTAAASAQITLASGVLTVATAPSVTAGSVQTFTAQLTIDPTSGQSRFGTHVVPATDNAVSCGVGALRWTAVYAVNGTIQTSSKAEKDEIARLDPARALDVARRTDLYEFTYKGHDRPHVGFYAEDVDALLSPDHASASPQTTAAVALAAVKALDARLTALEAR